MRNAKFFITGRPEDHIRAGFAIPELRTKELSLHDVDSVEVELDIRSFVKTELKEIASRNQVCVDNSWPLEEDIMAITKKAGGLFIIASVLVRFVEDPRSSPQDRLRLIIKMIFEGKGEERIDGTYEQVLMGSFEVFDKGDSEFLEQLQLVMASIVLAFHPLSRASLAGILGISSNRIWVVLRSLHSVLIVPDSDSELIRICHKSFADFLTDTQRCSDERFYIDGPSHHLRLGVFCLELMKRTLTKNICQLSPYVMNKDVKDLHTCREKWIGQSLAYGCGYWAKHLHMSTGARDDTGTAVTLVDEIFRIQFLSWLEVLSIEANLNGAIYSLKNVRSWLADVERSFPKNTQTRRSLVKQVLKSLVSKPELNQVRTHVAETFCC
jgi:hypothetical protein